MRCVLFLVRVLCIEYFQLNSFTSQESTTYRQFVGLTATNIYEHQLEVASISTLGRSLLQIELSQQINFKGKNLSLAKRKIKTKPFWNKIIPIQMAINLTKCSHWGDKLKRFDDAGIVPSMKFLNYFSDSCLKENKVCVPFLYTIAKLDTVRPFKLLLHC